MVLHDTTPVFTGVEACCVRGIVSNSNAKKLLGSLLTAGLSYMNNIRCYENFMVTIYGSLDVNDKSNVYAAEVFMKLRHDFFAFKFLNQALGIEISDTDVSFRTLLNIDSDRTPDYIHIKDFSIDIFEFAVTNSSDFADSKKGTPSDSKYDKEIRILKNEGWNVSYYPIIMRLDRTYKANEEEWGQFGLKVQLEEVYLTYKQLSDQFYRNYSHLFGQSDKSFKSQKALNEWKSMPYRRKKFFKYNIRNKADVLTTHRNRFLELLKTYDENNDKIMFVYNTTTGTVNSYKTEEGMYVKSLNDWFMSDLDNDKIVRYIQYKRRDLGFEIPEFELTDKISIENCFDQQLFNDHSQSCLINDQNFTEAMSCLRMPVHANPYGEPEPENVFSNGVPAPFDFDQVLRETINVIENPVSGPSMLCDYKNTQETREASYLKCSEHVRHVNTTSSNKINHPKSSFTMIIKPAGSVKGSKNISYTDVQPFLTKVTADTCNILRLMRTFKIQEPIVAASYSELPVLRQNLYELVENYNKAKSEWTKTENCTLVHRALLRFKDDKSKEAEKVRETGTKLRKFQKKHSIALRKYNFDKYYNRLPIPKTAATNIKKELSRYHNFKGYLGTGKYKSPGLIWDDQEILDEFKNCVNDLTEVTDSMGDFKVNFEGINNTIPFIDTLKNRAMSEINDFEAYMSRTSLGATLEYNSVLFKTILFMSSCPMKSKFVAVDNGSLKDTILLVKGGKSGSSASKAFKIITTVDPRFIKYYNCNNDNRSSWHFFDLNNKTYCETPWLRFQQGLCEHIHLAKYKFASFYLTMSEEINLKEIDLTKFGLPILMLLNGRRKLEILMGNYRQIVMNFRAEYANIDKLFEESVEMSRDYLYYFCTVYILTILKKMTTQQSKMYDPIVDDFSSDIMSWTVNLYASRILPKASVEYKIENRNDEISCLKTFNDCGITKDTKLEDFEIDFQDDPYSHDLNFNPKMSWIVGVFVSDMVKYSGGESSIYKGVRKVYGKNIYTTANNRGCRLDPTHDTPLDNMDLETYINLPSQDELKDLRKKIQKEKDLNIKAKLLQTYNDHMNTVKQMYDDELFGRKGYQAYLDTFTEFNTELLIKALEASGPVSASSLLNQDNTTLFKIYDKVWGRKISQIIASMHAKIQWMGAREIFALTVKSKLPQQLAEGVFKVLCQHMPNEMISIPSDRRTMWLHSTIHQRAKPGSHIISLDYRRWGPHTNFRKYKYFVQGLIDILPPSFYELFMEICEKMENKYIIIKREDLKAIYNHEIVKEALQRTHIKYYQDYVLILEPHSFIMGIYNYLSSLFHAGSQLLYRHLLHMSELKKTDPTIDFYAIAHSDDAQGMFTCTHDTNVEHILKSYETFSKYLNHMQSNKKSYKDMAQSEVISILRIDRKIISLIAKFSTNLTVAPSYKGYVNEAKNLTSKIIELLINGATLNQAYKVYRILVYYLNYSIYHFNKPVYDYPLEVLGTPDEYPLLLLLYGTQANFLTNYYYHKEINLRTQEFARISKISMVDGLLYNPNTRNVKKIDIEKYIKVVPDKLKELLNSDTILMLNFKSDTLARLQIIARMKDPNFAAAMAGGHALTGLSYLFKNNSRFAYSLQGDMYVPWAARIKLHEEIMNTKPNANLQTTQILDYMLQDMKMFEFLPEKVELAFSACFLKPCKFVVDVSTIRGMRQISSRKVHCYLYEKQFLNLMDFSNTELNQLKLFESITEGMDLNQKDLLAQSVCLESNQPLYFYGTLPSDKRTVETKSDLATFISYNTFRNQVITNVTDRTLPETLTDAASRNLLEAASVIKEMCSCLYQNIRTTFLREYEIEIDGKVTNLRGAVDLCKNDLDPYRQAFAYQIAMLINYPRITWGNLPLFRFIKRQQGSGYVWFGEGKVEYITRQSRITANLVNCSVKSITINKGTLDSDLRFFINELIHIGIRCPFYTKDLSNKTETLCIGFNSVYDMEGKITMSNMCDFIYPYCIFTDYEIYYPNVKPLDDRKVTTSSGRDIYYVRLSKTYSYTSVMDKIDLPSNREWFKKYLKVETPWFRKIDTSYRLLHKPCLQNVIELGFNYVFTHEKKVSEIAGPLWGPRAYIPGISGGIVECIMNNRPEYIRTPYETKLWHELSKRYPGSFLKTIYKERAIERTRKLNEYLKALYYESESYVRVTRTYITDVLSICDYKEIEHISNIRIMLETYKRNAVPYLLTTCIDLVESLQIFKKYKCDNNIVYTNLLRLSKGTYKFLAAYEIYQKFDKLNQSDYYSMQREIGRPWSLIPFDKTYLTYFSFQLVNYYRISLDHLLDEMKQDPTFEAKPDAVKDKIRFKLLAKVDERLVSYEKIFEKTKPQTKHELFINIKVGYSQGSEKWWPNDKLEYHKNIIFFKNKTPNYKYYDDDECFEDNMLDDNADDGLDRKTVYKNKKTEQGFKKVPFDTSIIGTKWKPLRHNTALPALYGCPTPTVIVYTADYVEYINKFPSTIIVYHPQAACFIFSTKEGLEVTQTTGEIIPVECYEFLYKLYFGKQLGDGRLMDIGEMSRNFDPPIELNIDEIKQILLPKDDIMYIEFLGRQMAITHEQLQNISKKHEDSRQDDVNKLYEPLGLFVTDKGLETLIDTAFPKTGRHILKGKVKIDSITLKIVKNMFNTLKPTEKPIIARLLRSISIVEKADSLTILEKAIAYDFVNEIIEFMNPNVADDDFTEDDMLMDKNLESTVWSQSDIPENKLILEIKGQPAYNPLLDDSTADDPTDQD
nr:MAG: RNA-dependent RNA polymerase [Longquan rodent bunyavirus 1]